MFSRLGGVAHEIRDEAIFWSVSPDGSQVAFGTNKDKSGEREIWLMDSNGKGAHKLFDSNDDTAVCCLSWSPDGQRYIYTSTNGVGNTVLSRDTQGGIATNLFSPSETSEMNDIVWLRDGRTVYSRPESDGGSVCNYWTVRFDLHTGQRIDKPKRLTNWASFCMSSGAATADSKRLTFRGYSGFGTAYVADLEAGGTHIRNPRHFTLQEWDEFITSWTADSSTVIIGVSRGDHYGLYKQSLNSDKPEPIAPNVAGGPLGEAILSPDGKWIIIIVFPVGARPLLTPAPVPLLRVPVDGGAPEPMFEVVRPGPFTCARAPATLCVIPEQSADHRQMVVTAFDPIKGRGPELARFDLDRDIDPLIDNIVGIISPDGTRLAVARGPNSPIEIRSLHGQPTITIPAKGLDRRWNVEWAADGKGLLVARHVQDGTDLVHVDLKGKISPLWKSNGPRCSGTPSPDGRHLAIYDWKRGANMWMMENF